ncbi:hypothetical protein ACIA8G_40455 [Lentzea sp. NPDC051213]|uniref:hypothetical protein n=1 Tax=Lentzea sp. NPDC051213 TaxID=3364126 RepID=UPI00378F88D5
MADRLGSGVEFRLGSVAETWHGCAAMVMWWPIAYERHGGTPKDGIARVLLNVRDDAPELVLATPPGPGLTAGLDPVEADREVFSLAVLGACVEAYRRELPDQENSTVLIHLEAAALDQGDMAATASGIARFLAEAVTA